MLKSMWAAPRKYRLLGALLHREFYTLTYMLLKKRAVPEEWVVTFSEKIPICAPYRETGFSIVNAQKPIISVIEITRTLKNQGYTVHILSNIGVHAFAQLKNRFPEFLSHFDGACVTCPENQYRRKPHPDQFTDCFAPFIAQNKKIVFIDDSYKNCVAAQSAGATFIHARSHKQLLSDIKKQLPNKI